MKKLLRNYLISQLVILIVIVGVGLRSSYAERQPNEVVQPEEMMEFTQDLADISGYGIRSGIHPGPSGGKADQAAAYIFDTLTKHARAGLKVRMESVKMTNAHTKESKVTVTVSGQSPKEILHHPLRYNTTTPSQGIEGVLAYVGFGNSSDFDAVDVNGKIALIDTDKVCDYDQTINTLRGRQTALTKGSIAVISAELRTPVPRGGEVGNETTPSLIPMLSVGKPEGDYLRNLALSGSPHTVNIMVDAAFGIIYDVNYVVAELEGNGSIDEVLMQVSHFSTTFTGVVDNLASVALNLGMAKYFAHQPKASRNRDRIFLFSFGHDAANNNGEEDFALKNEELLKKTIVLDLDHVVPGVGYAYDETLQEFVPNGMDSNRQIRGSSGVLVSVAMFVLDKHGLHPTLIRQLPSGGGGDSNFYRRGTPVLESGMAHPYFYHTMHDTPDKITVDVISRNFPAQVEVSQMVDSTPEGYIFHADKNQNRLPFLPNTPPEIEMILFTETVRVGDTAIVALDEQKWYDDKASHLYSQQLPEYASLIFNWGDGTPDVNGEGRTWSATHVYELPGTYTVTMTLTDSQGAQGTASQIITVLP